MIALVVALSLAAPSQEPVPTVRFMRHAAADVVVELVHVGSKEQTVLAKVALPLERVTAIDAIKAPDHWFRITVSDHRPLMIASVDALSGDVWHIPEVSDRGVMLWSTDGSIQQPRFGAAMITADPSACQQADLFAVTHPSFAANSTSAVDLFTTTDLSRCRWVVVGVAGTYQATLRNGSQPAGKRQFSVRPTETASVTVSPPAVLISGTVTINDTPVPRGTLLFMGYGISPRVDLRPDGSFETTLDEPGTYRVALTSPNAPAKSISRTFSLGGNTFDWAIRDKAADTRITIRISGNDRAERTDIEIRHEDDLVIDGIPAGETTMERKGHEFGKHRIIARQADATSEWQEIELSAEQPAATVELALTRATRSITLRYADGEPVMSPAFSTNTLVRPPEIAPGTYSLASIPARTRLVVRPPSGAPLCKVVPPSGDLVVFVSSARSVTLQFENKNMTIGEVSIATDGGADCPVPLTQFLKSPLRVGPDDTTQVEVLNAPADDVLIVHTRDGGHRAIVAAGGVVFIPAKQ